MLILSLDSAGGGCGACVWLDSKILAAAEEQMERGQDQRLMPLILDVMKKAGVTFDALDRIAVTRGPGSFTGLRIGLAAARGIGLASGKPVIGIDRFSIFRAQVAETDANVLVIINSKRKELFCRFYPSLSFPRKRESSAGDSEHVSHTAHGHAPLDPRFHGDDTFMLIPEEIRDFLKGKPGTIVTGDMPLSGTNFRPPQQKETVTAAALAATAKADDPAFLPRPLYLREADVTIKAS